MPEAPRYLIRDRDCVYGAAVTHRLRTMGIRDKPKSTLKRVRVSFKRKRNLDAKTRKRVQAPDPHGMSGGAIFGTPMNDATIKGKPNPKLIGIMTDCPPSSNEIFGPSTAIVMAIVRDAWGKAIPVRLQAPNVKTRCS